MSVKNMSVLASAPELGTLLEPIKEELEQVERFLNSNLVDDSPFIQELLSQVFQSGGKRIRPALVLLSAKATAPQNNIIDKLQITLSVLTELIHTASLVHDDVIDSASLRRGQETVNRKWSDKLAVLVGDLLFAQASICLSRLMSPPIVGIYGQVLGDLCAGEIRQMRQQFLPATTWDTYIQKSTWKTASLFAAGTQSAAILNGCNELVIQQMRSYGLNLGICFQIIDDLLDITGNAFHLGKAPGSDLAQGIITAPCLFVLEKKDSPALQLEHLISSRKISSKEGLEEALAIINKAGGIEATMTLASQYAKKSNTALKELPPSCYRDSLEFIIEWLLTRTN